MKSNRKTVLLMPEMSIWMPITTLFYIVERWFISSNVIIQNLKTMMRIKKKKRERKKLRDRHWSYESFVRIFFKRCSASKKNFKPLNFFMSSLFREEVFLWHQDLKCHSYKSFWKNKKRLTGRRIKFYPWQTSLNSAIACLNDKGNFWMMMSYGNNLSKNSSSKSSSI